jgi:hypothetical protein
LEMRLHPGPLVVDFLVISWWDAAPYTPEVKML